MSFPTRVLEDDPECCSYVLEINYGNSMGWVAFCPSDAEGDWFEGVIPDDAIFVEQNPVEGESYACRFFWLPARRLSAPESEYQDTRVPGER